jgi:CRISPR-associated endoribonuclease Cas6
MRIKINLSAGNDVSIPIEYNYNIYLNTRKTLFDYLQTNKPKLFSRYKKSFPDFTFSQLMIPERKIETGFIQILGNFFSIYFSSVDDTFVEYLVKAFNLQKSFQVYNHAFQLKKIEILDEPVFEPEMRFKMLSPLLLISVKDGKPYFMRPGDIDLSDVFASMLVKEYNKTYNAGFQPSQIRLILDQDYVERKKVITRFVTIRNINYKTIFCPITLKGEPDLTRFAYRNGIGDKTNYGLGMIETLGG